MSQILYVTSALHALHRTPGMVGPPGSNVWSIMARPRVKLGEGGHGRCWPFVPGALAPADTRAALNVARVRDQTNFDDQRSAVAREHDVPELDMVGAIEPGRKAAALQTYRDSYFDGPARRIDGDTVAPCRHQHPDLGPGDLMAAANAGGLYTVRHGDCLICACSVARAIEGQCHRAWAAVLLVANGWRVFLDGNELELSNPPRALRGVWPRKGD